MQEEQEQEQEEQEQEQEEQRGVGLQVLMVGAGGIGCELLKDLVLSSASSSSSSLLPLPLRSITILDLDTIELSNLNRQFLFRREHIGRSKAECAAEASRKRWGSSPGESAATSSGQENHRGGAASIRQEDNKRVYSAPALEVIHGNVKAPQFDVDFFKRFDLCFNALDNMSARRHVNRLCVSGGVPLIESGTAGFLGQTQPILPKVLRCFECDARALADDTRTYASCTIKSSPTLPVHCVVWAKEEFLQTFSGLPGSGGDGDNNEGVAEDDDGNADDWSALAQDTQLLAARAKLAESWSAGSSLPAGSRERLDAALADPHGFAAWLFGTLFGLRILERRRLAVLTEKDLWPGRAPPEPLKLEDLLLSGSNDSAATATADVYMEDQRVWDEFESARRFQEATATLLARQREQLDAGVSSSAGVPFDKDDNDVMSWVTAASNLRCHIFGIARQSLFDTKSLAANIIPAIATTNAAVAGLMVLEAARLLKLLGEHPRGAVAAGTLSDAEREKIQSSCATTYLWSSMKPPATGRMVSTERGQAPNKSCFVCGGASLTLRIDTHKHTLGTLVDDVLRAELAFSMPTVTEVAGLEGLFESGDDLDADEVQMWESNKAKVLADFHCAHNAELDCEDFTQDLKIRVTIQHVAEADEEDDDQETARHAQTKPIFELVGDAPAPAATVEATADSSSSGAAPSQKRKAPQFEGGEELTGAEEPDSKRRRTDDLG